MPQLTIDLGNGASRTVEVPDTFTALPPDQQHAQVDDIKAHLQSDKSFGSALRYGLGGMVAGGADTADVAGAPAVAGALRQAAGVINPQNYSPAAPRIGEELKAGNYGEAASYVPRALAEGVAPGLGLIGAAAGGAAIGGPVGAVGAVAAPFAAGAATSYGTNVKERAKAAGHAEPTAADYTGAIPGTAVEAGLGAVGTGIIPGVKQAISKLPGYLSAPARVALDAAATGGADVAGQAAQGRDIDPYEAAGAAAQGAGARVSLEGTGAGKAVVKAGGDRIARAGLPEMTPEEGLSLDRVNRELEQARQDAALVSGKDNSDTSLLNNIKKQKTDVVWELANKLRLDGYISDENFRTLVRPAVEQAQVHNSALTDGKGTAFGDLRALDIPAEKLQPLIDGIRDLNTVSDQTLIKNTRGPFQAALGALGHVAGVGATIPLALSGHYEPLIAAALGHTLTSRVAGGVGSGLDRFFGTNSPPIVLQAQQAARMARQAGIDPSTPGSTAQMQSAIAAQGDERAALGRILQQNAMHGAALMPPEAPAMSGNTPAEQVLAMRPLHQAQLADTFRMSVEKLLAGAKAGLTPNQIIDAVNLRERVADKVSGMAHRNGDWPNPQVAEANFVNTDGMAGRPDTGYTTPGYSRGDGTIVGQPSTTGGAGAAAAAETTARVTDAMQEAQNEMQNQAGASIHGSEMAIKAATNARVKRVLDGGGQANARPNTASGVEGTAGASHATGDQMAANGGAQEAAPVAQAKASTAAKQAASGIPSGKAPEGWKAGVQKILNGQGIPTTVPDIHSAVDTLATHGGFDGLVPQGMGPQTFGMLLKQHKGTLYDPVGKEAMRRVYAQVAHDKGVPHLLDQEASGPAPTFAAQPGAAQGSPLPVREPVRHPTRWNGAADQSRKGAVMLSDLAMKQGLHSTAAAILRVQEQPLAAKKAAIRDTHLSSLPAPLRQHASDFFTPALMHGVK